MNPFTLIIALAFLAIIAGFLSGCSITTDGERTTYSLDGVQAARVIQIIAEK